MRAHSGDGIDAAGLKVTPVLPEQVHGFRVRVGIGPYPQDQHLSPERAVYAELTPVTPANVEKMRRAGRDRILATVPLTRQAALDVMAEPHGQLAETVSLRALAEASRLARLVDQA